jgi:outer membrane protein assembly factor BamB
MQKLITSNPARQSGRHALLAVLSLVMLAACSEPEFVLEGDRIDVLPAQVIETADAAALAEGAGLAVEVNIANAPVVGLTAGHAGGNPRLAAPLTQIWSASIGGAGSRLTDLAMPVVGDGRVFTVALNGMVKAFAIDNGAVIWTSNIEQIADDALPGIGGGMAVTADGLAVHAGGRRLAMLNPADGTTLWSLDLDIPLRGGPTPLGDDRLAVTDLDGNMIVFTTAGGEQLWEHYGIAADTVLFGAPSPAHANDEIVLAGSGGEVSYFDALEGELLWTDSVAALLPRTPIQNIGDVRAHPVHDGGLIFVIGQSGRIVAFNARSGLPVWERAIGGLEMPWVSGKSLFVVSLDGRLFALRRDDGAVRWVTELEGALPAGVVVSEDSLRHFGPVVAGGRVYVVSGKGNISAFNADTGEKLESVSVGAPSSTAPQVAAGKMFVLGSNGTLTVFE